MSYQRVVRALHKNAESFFCLLSSDILWLIYPLLHMHPRVLDVESEVSTHCLVRVDGMVYRCLPGICTLADERLLIWDVEGRSLPEVFKGGEPTQRLDVRALTVCCASRDGTYLYSADDTKVHVFDSTTLAPVLQIDLPAEVLGMCVDIFGTLVLGIHDASHDGIALIEHWDGLLEVRAYVPSCLIRALCCLEPHLLVFVTTESEVVVAKRTGQVLRKIGSDVSSICVDDAGNIVCASKVYHQIFVTTQHGHVLFRWRGKRLFAPFAVSVSEGGVLTFMECRRANIEQLYIGRVLCPGKPVSEQNVKVGGTVLGDEWRISLGVFGGEPLLHLSKAEE